METENPRIRIAKKIYSPPKDTPRKKKKNQKDLDSQQPEGALDISQQKISEPEPSANPQLVQYIYKLQHDLIETKKKLKYEQIKFTNLITSVSSHFDKDGKNFLESMDCGNVFREMEDSGEQESGFEKFFTTHKYLISDKKIEPVAEDENNGDQKPKTKAPKAKASAGVVKINLKDVEGDKPEAQNDKEPVKKSKKKKASSPVEEEKESKKKRIKKNTPAAGEETAANKGVDMSKVIVISPTEKEAGGHEADKVRKAEDAINKYEEMAHMKPGPEAYGGMMQNNMFNEGIKYMMQQAKVDPTSLLNQQMMRGNIGYPMMPNGEPIDQAKLVQELIKQGINDPVLMGMAAPTQELLNYYQRAFQS